MHTLLPESSKYIHDAFHRWLSILVKEQAPVGVEQLKTVDMCACFALVDKEDKLSDPWRCAILRKMCKTM